MTENLNHPDVVSFIAQHENADVNTLLLKYKDVAGIPISVIVNQMVGRRKAKDKFPFLYNQPSIVYPPALNLEQSSSEETATLKQQELRSIPSGSPLDRAADLTGGFGIDTYFLSQLVHEFHYVEPDGNLLQIVTQNLAALGAKNIQSFNSTAEAYLSELSHTLSFVFVDPSRRARGNRKVFKLSDCEPDVTQLQDQIFEHTNTLMIKTSPLLDVNVALSEVKFVKKIVVVSVDNDCKELLLICSKDFNESPAIKTINIRKHETEIFEYQFQDENNAVLEYGEPMEFLYEPNASILKAGAFKLIGANYNLRKLHQNTHLYTSSKLIESFPGRIFRILNSLKADSKSVKQFLPEGKANVTTRNYPVSVEELKKKIGVKDGGDRYVIGYTDAKKKGLLLAERLK